MHHPIGSIAKMPHPSFFARQEHGSENQRERVSCALRVIKGFAYRKLPSWICLCGGVSLDSEDIVVVWGPLSFWLDKRRLSLNRACSWCIFCHLWMKRRRAKTLAGFNSERGKRLLHVSFIIKTTTHRAAAQRTNGLARPNNLFCAHSIRFSSAIAIGD